MDARRTPTMSFVPRQDDEKTHDLSLEPPLLASERSVSFTGFSVLGVRLQCETTVLRERMSLDSESLSTLVG